MSIFSSKTSKEQEEHKVKSHCYVYYHPLKNEMLGTGLIKCVQTLFIRKTINFDEQYQRREK